MSLLPDSLKRRLFWVFARTCFFLYRRLPIFGFLRASIAVIQRDQQILVIQRNDGRGISLPGGIAGWREAEDVTLRREVLEETGLQVISAHVEMRFQSTADVPCNVAVFSAEVSGELRDSWEGSPRWMTIAEFEPRLLESQRPVLDLMRKIVERESGA